MQTNIRRVVVLICELDQGAPRDLLAPALRPGAPEGSATPAFDAPPATVRLRPWVVPAVAAEVPSGAGPGAEVKFEPAGASQGEAAGEPAEGGGWSATDTITEDEIQAVLRGDPREEPCVHYRTKLPAGVATENDLWTRAWQFIRAICGRSP